MKTNFDLRIQFRTETGNYPVFRGYYLINNKYDQFQELTSKYGLWLEEKLGDSIELRSEFLNNYHTLPVEKNWRRPNEILNYDYILWLEAKELENAQIE